MIYNTGKLEKKLIFAKNMAILLIFIGVVLLLLEDYSGLHSFKNLVSVVDSLVFPILGIILWIISSKNLKKISGSYVEFNDNQISFKSRQYESTNIHLTDLVEIDIKLKSIELKDLNGNLYSIHLDDYIHFADKKEIKEKFALFQKRIETTHNST